MTVHRSDEVRSTDDPARVAGERIAARGADMAFDVGQIIGLVKQLGGDHQQAAQQLQGLGQVDPGEHAGLLSRLGIDPQRLQSGGYQQQFDAQQQGGYGQDQGQQQGGYGQDQGQQQGGYGQDQGQQQGGYGQDQGQQQGGYGQDQGQQQGGYGQDQGQQGQQEQGRF